MVSTITGSLGQAKILPLCASSTTMPPRTGLALPRILDAARCKSESSVSTASPPLARGAIHRPSRRAMRSKSSDGRGSVAPACVAGRAARSAITGNARDPRGIEPSSSLAPNWSARFGQSFGHSASNPRAFSLIEVVGECGYFVHIDLHERTIAASWRIANGSTSRSQNANGLSSPRTAWSRCALNIEGSTSRPRAS